MNRKYHMALIAVGIAYISIGIFHTNIWFDESYSVAIANHTFAEIWIITSHDVHPPLYYWMLHILNLIFGQNILIYRIFSMFGIASAAFLGYTHIRKDYNEKIGVIFSFITLFLPIVSVYANEIRMYSWTLFFVTLTYIYVNRLLKKFDAKNLIFFSILSLINAYLHYYGLLASAVFNLYIFSILIKNKRKKELQYFITAAAFQIMLYFPWIISLLSQVRNVVGGFWISLKFPDTLIEILGFQFDREITLTGNFQLYASFLTDLLLYLYIIYKLIRLKSNNMLIQAKRAMFFYFSIISIALLISLAMKSPILYARYIITITGLWIIALSGILSEEKKKTAIILICAAILIFSVFNTYSLIKMNYDKSNMTQITYLQKNIQPSDIIVYTDIGIGSVYATYFRNQSQYFYNPDDWGVEIAYQAYAPQMTTVTDLSFLNGYTGRIWIIDSENAVFYKSAFQNADFISNQLFKTAYYDYIYNLILINKQI